MKIRFGLGLSALVGLSLLLAITPAAKAAASPEAFYTSRPTACCASADGTSVLEVIVHAQAYGCDPSNPYLETRSSPERCSNGGASSRIVDMQMAISATVTGGAYFSSPSSGTTDSSGYFGFSIKSSTVGSSRVQVTASTAPGVTGVVASQTFYFDTYLSPTKVTHPPLPSGPPSQTTSKAPSQAATTTPSQTSQPSASQPAVAATPPASLVEPAMLDNNKLDPNAPGDKLPTVEVGKTFQISGKASPNTDLIVYVFSEPKAFKTKSDADGKWSVSISGLPVGQHHAELELIDSAGTAQPRINLGAFNVIAASKNVSSVAVKNNNHTRAILIINGLTALFAAVGGYIAYKTKIGRSLSAIAMSIIPFKHSRNRGAK